MSTRHPVTTALEDPAVPVRLRLVAAWTTATLLYAYVDILAFFKPGVVDLMLDGKVWEFEATESLLTTFLALMAIPIVMVLLSATLPARANRMTNLVVASIQIPWAAFNLAGGSWPLFYGLGVVLEVAVFVIVLRVAWTWRRTAPSADLTSAPGAEMARAPR